MEIITKTKEDTIKYLNAKLCDLYRDARTLESAVGWLKKDLEGGGWWMGQTSGQDSMNLFT